MMQHKKITIFLILLSVLLFSIGIILAIPEEYGLCNPIDLDCITKFSEEIAQPLVVLNVCLFVISALLFFTYPAVFHMWKYFALVYLPLAALAIINTPVLCDSGFGFTPCLDKELATWGAAIIFLVLSLGIIFYKQTVEYSKKPYPQK